MQNKASKKKRNPEAVIAGENFLRFLLKVLGIFYKIDKFNRFPS